MAARFETALPVDQSDESGGRIQFYPVPRGVDFFAKNRNTSGEEPAPSTTVTTSDQTSNGVKWGPVPKGMDFFKVRARNPGS